MAPKEPFKVHSLAKHVEDTNKGLSASAQYNRRPGSKAAAVPVKKEPGVANANLFGNNDDSDESSDSSDSDSDEDNGTNFIKKIGANGTKPSATPTPKRRSKDEEIADSDVERTASAKKAAAAKKEKVPKKEESSSESSSDSSSESESEESDPKAKTNGARAKPAAVAQDSSSSSSEEESDDDSSDDDETSKAVAKMLTIPPALKGAKDTAKANTKAAAKENTKPVAKKDESSSSSEEESSEEESSEEESSDSEAESTKPEATKPVAATPKAAKPVAATPKAAKPVAATPKAAKPVAATPKTLKPVPATPKATDPEAIRKALKDSSMDTESESESESEAEASEEEEESDDEVDQSMQISNREMDKQLGVPKFIAPDFTLRKGDDGANGEDVARICNEANLQGKQVWYFTVPSNVPISVIQNMEIPMDRSQFGGPVFSHEGQDYGATFDTITPKSSIQILIPSSGDSNYRSG
jgi:hypothetical protein